MADIDLSDEGMTTAAHLFLGGMSGPDVYCMHSHGEEHASSCCGLAALLRNIRDAARREMQERCAKVCDDRAKHRSAESTTDDAVTQVLNLEAEACALRIRALEVKP